MYSQARMESMNFLGRVGILFAMNDGSCGTAGIQDVEGMGMMIAGVVTMGDVVELLLDCSRLRCGPARDAEKVGSARAEMMEADGWEIRGEPMGCTNGIEMSK